MGEGGAKQGGTFAANLSREGEKANYNYLVRWVHNPRERSAPYCPFEKKDLTAEDYQRHGQPFVFDLAHTKCPNDGHELQVQQMTPMPSLRLTEDEARDIATYLTTRKRSGATYASTDYMDDPKLKNQGLALVRNYGCAACHEIAGLEEEQRIGTELTKEGSKPIERLDFALLGHEAEREGWETHKGFFEHKLKDPAVYDTGKEKAKQAGPAEDAELQPVEAGDRCGHHVLGRLRRCQRALTVFLQPRRAAAGRDRWLVGDSQVQLHGLP
jgi:hypothetical protein